MTPLHWAVKAGQIESAKLLLDAGAEPNVKDQMGHTPVLLAVEHPKLLALLIANGGEVSILKTNILLSIWNKASVMSFSSSDTFQF